VLTSGSGWSCASAPPMRLHGVVLRTQGQLSFLSLPLPFTVLLRCRGVFTCGSIRQLVGLLGRVIGPTQGLYLHRTTQHRETQTHIHAPSRIWTCDPNIRATEGSTCLRPLGYWDRLVFLLRLQTHYHILMLLSWSHWSIMYRISIIYECKIYSSYFERQNIYTRTPQTIL
jgi:hypothetical protein